MRRDGGPAFPRPAGHNGLTSHDRKGRNAMASLNRVQLIGNLGRDPETKYMPSGDAVTNISIATSERGRTRRAAKRRSTPNGIA
jgi:hypothetical protein